MAEVPAPATHPHVLLHSVLGGTAVADLLTYVANREADFRPALVRNRNTGELRVDHELRSAMSLADLGPFKTPFKEFVRRIAAPVLAQLNLPETGAEPRDFEITAFGDGQRFGVHIDTDERLTRVRLLSCVYYFAVTPRRFSGGALRLYGLPTLSQADSPRFIDINPDTDAMVVFPSWLRHEVLPVHVPSGAWLDRRFTINCWLHRATPRPNSAPAS